MCQLFFGALKRKVFFMGGINAVATFPIERETLKRPPQFTTRETFGERLARYRKIRGLTQAELAQKIGATQRMIAYYESQTKFPPAHLLPVITKALHVSLDELFGLKTIPLPDDVNTKSRVWQELKHVSKLTPKEKKAILNFLRTFVKKTG